MPLCVLQSDSLEMLQAFQMHRVYIHARQQLRDRHATRCADAPLDGALPDTHALTAADTGEPGSTHSTEGAGWGPRPGVLADATEPHSPWQSLCYLQTSRGLEKAQGVSKGPGPAGVARLACPGLPGVCPHTPLSRSDRQQAHKACHGSHVDLDELATVSI